MRRGLRISVAFLLVPMAAISAANANAAVTVDEQGGLAVSEAGPTTDTYTLVLTTQPSATVTINVSVVDGQTQVSNGGPFSSTVSLGFNGSDWNVPKTVTVIAVDDAVDEVSPHIGTVMHTASSSDGNYNGISIADATADITDNDTGGVTVDQGGGLAVSETGPTTDTYTLVLDTPPSATVTITATALAGQTQVSTDNVNFGTSATLTFASGNWFTPQVVYVRAVDDAIDEASPHIGTITHTASSSDGQYNGISIADGTAVITDNDTAGVIITVSGGSTDVDETGPTSDTYTVVLTSEPSATTTITVTADAQTLVSKNGVTFGATTTLTFTAANWFAPQTVTVRAVDDFVDEAAIHTGAITHTASGAAEYVALNPLQSVTTNITDNDTAGVIITESGGSTDVTEGGATDTYTIVLDTQPVTSVTISFNTGTQIQPIANVTFTTGNWNVAKTITVAAVDDGTVEGAHTGTIMHTASSSDSSYNGIGIANVTANISDNDSFAVIVTESGGSTDVAEAGATDTYTLVLDSQPASDVTISFNTDTQIQPIASINFTTADWNTPKTITVTAVDDGIDEGPHTGTITHSATSADPNYNGISVPNVTANITDAQGGLFTVTPCRVLDTRTPQQGPALTSGVVRVLDFHGVCGISATARAVAVTFAVTEATGAGHLTLYPADEATPSTSSINFAAAQIRSGNAVVGLAGDGSGTLAALPQIVGSGTVHLIVDVSGFFE